MAQVRVKPTKRLQKSVRRNLNRILQQRDILEGVGEIILKDVKGQTRRRKEPGSRENFDDLETTTVKHREYLAKYNQTSDVFSPKRSNLNLTGQLIGSIESKIDRKRARVFIRPTGQRTPYKGKKGNLKQTVTSNKQLAAYVEEKRPFLRVHEIVKKRVTNHIKRILRRALGKKS